MLQEIYNLFRLPKYVNIFPRFCGDCKWSRHEDGSRWSNRCMNPLVNARDSWALATNNHDGHHCGSETIGEREKNWGGVCGKVGFLWEPKEEV